MNAIKRRVALLSGVLTVVAASPVFATSFSSPGAACHNFSTGTGTISAWNYAQNNAAASLTMTCPLPFSGAESQSNFGVGIVFYNDTSSLPIWCDPISLNHFTGSVILGDTLYSCSSVGGCTSNTNPTFTGTGNLSWSGATNFALHFTDFTGAVGFICGVAPASSLLEYGIGG